MAEDFTGFDDFSKLLEKYIGKTEKGNVMQVLEIGAEDLARDVRALPKPRRPGGGRTHMLDSVVTKRRGEEIEVGWGKYYGPFVENGTRKMGAQPHMKPTFNRNKEKYYRKMQKALFD